MKHEVIIPADWKYEHIPKFEYDDDGELEVDNLMCRVCKHSGDRCKCIDHKHIHFHKPYFKCDVYTGWHTICRVFEIDRQLYPAGGLAWDALGGFDEWQRLWRKQWHPRIAGVYRPSVPLVSAYPAPDGRETGDDVFYVSYEDFVDCKIMREDGIRCIDYQHIERTKQNPIGYTWCREGAGIWYPWENNRYEKMGG